MSDTFYTVEIPHQRPAEVTEWPTQQDALEFFADAMLNAAPSDPEPATVAEIFDWVARDLHAFRAFGSLEELHKWATAFRGHQWITVRAQVETLCEEVQS